MLCGCLHFLAELGSKMNLAQLHFQYESACPSEDDTIRARCDTFHGAERAVSMPLETTAVMRDLTLYSFTSQ